MKCFNKSTTVCAVFAAALTLTSGIALAEDYTIGSLTLSDPFSRATLPNAPVAGGFMMVRNDGSGDDRLVAASSQAAGRMEIHEMAMQNDVMKMRELEEGLPIPAGGMVELKPGGYHIMFMDLQHPLVEGEEVSVTLTFETAGEITVPFVIGAPNAGRQGHGDGGDGGGHGMSNEGN